MTLFQLIRSDYNKHLNYGSHFLAIVFFNQGFWAVFQYRIANYIHSKVRLQPFRIVFLGLMLLWQKVIEIVTGIAIPYSAQIGHSFYIGHFGGIIINANAKIGHNCNISQGVTIGISGQDERRGVPIIGDNVYIGVNSVVAGKITIESNVLIGACSLVTQSLPEYAVAVGVPASIISSNGSNGYI